MAGWGSWLYAAVAPRVEAQRAAGQIRGLAAPQPGLSGSRFSPLDQINPANVKTLTPRWLFQHGVIDGVSNQTTPIIVDGVMYVTDPRGSVYAVNAADGHLLWTYDVTNLIGGGAREGYVFRNRGVAYADGVVYTAAGSFLFALDAKTGQADSGLRQERPGQRDPRRAQAALPGRQDGDQPRLLVHDRAAGPQRRDLHRQHAQREPHSRRPRAGGGCEDRQGAAGTSTPFRRTRRIRAGTIAGPTWVGGERNGGGIWETPSIDPELGLLYVAVGNPFGDSTKRAGINLFTDSILALSLEHRRAEVVLPADAPRRVGLRLGQPADPVRHAGARAAREGAGRGEQERVPLHPEPRDRAAGASDQGNAGADRNGAARGTAVADAADSVHGERQADGAGDARCSRWTSRRSGSRRSSWCRCSRRRGRTDQRAGHRRRRELRPDVLQPADRAALRQRHRQPANSGRPAEGLFLGLRSDDRRAEVAAELRRLRPGGSVVTAGGMVFVGSGSNTAGYFFAFDAKTGELLWKFNTGSGVFSSPSIYMVNGEQFVTVGSGGGERGRRGGDLILSFALPARLGFSIRLAPEDLVMNARSWAVVGALVMAVSAGLESQQQGVQSTSLPSPAGREPSWAFPVQAGTLPAEAPGPKSVPGSTKQYTPQQIDDLLNPPDWFRMSTSPGPGTWSRAAAARWPAARAT